MKSAISILFAVLMIASGVDTARAAVLKAHASVDAEVVRLGDLFADAGDAASKVVAPAPPAGDNQVFDAEQLRDIARAAGLGWAPRTRYDRVVVERLSVTLQPDEIANRVRRALLDAGMDKERRITLSKRDMTVAVPPGSVDEVRIEGARFDERGGRFAVALVVPKGAGATERHHVTGRIHEITQVPVLTRRVNRGEVISRSDVELVEMPRDGLARNVILDPAQLIGKTPRRLLAANAALRPGDVQAPIVVTRGALVTLVLRTNRMLITARGKALDDAAQGDSVRVMNIRSRSTIEGVVEGPNQVVVNTLSIAR